MKEKLNKLDMDFNEALARLAQTPKSAVDKAVKEQAKSATKPKPAKPPKTRRV